MKKLVENIYSQKNKFIIIGLTGKTGSGCSTISNILNNGYVNYNSTNCEDTHIQNRKDNIIQNFASKNFINKKFQTIRPSTIIMMLFVFEKSIFLSQIKLLTGLLEKGKEQIQKVKNNIKVDKLVDVDCEINIEWKKKIKEECRKILDLYSAFINFNIQNKLDKTSKFEQLLNLLQNNYNEKNKLKLLKYIKATKKNYEIELLSQSLEDLVIEINTMLGCSFKPSNKIFKKIKYNKKHEVLKKSIIKKKLLNDVLIKLATSKTKSHIFINLYEKYNKLIIQNRDDKKLSIRQLQVIGDLVREKVSIFELPEYTNLLIKAYRNISKEQGYCYIVIDSLKNPFEIVFFKKRYSAYYTFSVHATDETIYERFSKKKIDIKAIHQKELNKDDTDKQKGSLDSVKDFNSQNIIECVQRSDIYIDNNKDQKDTLYKQVFKYLSLIVHPGIITPTKDEMIMQLALNAKFNSGCISRQVGAVVLNKHASVKAIGWNEVPEGQMPCLLRSHNELLNNTSLLDYSNYERNKLRKTNEFKFILNKQKNQYATSNNMGLNDAFCFKQVQNKIDDEKNQVYTRSLHAEENAFLQASKYGNSEIIGGQLFTTASPCFLCAKKAYQLGIKRIVYIEAYPDISREQVFEIGINKITMVHFRGAIGLAYQKLYEPIFSYKDELKALNTEQIRGD
ncbi:MAG: deaminase [Sulfurimonas sp.]|nr:deaminase [Sulfurimonas sp.]